MNLIRFLTVDLSKLFGLEDSDFKKLENDDDLVGATAMDVYMKNYELQPNEDVDIIHYPTETAPWGFALYLAVMYSI